MWSQLNFLGYELSICIPEEPCGLVRQISQKWLLLADLLGTFVFALEGAMVAAEGGLDWFGILVISFVMASGGGIIRDLLIEAIPP
jgi:uncharacterized membrane protein YeiH